MSDDKLDRFARGELSAMESRELAQKGLDDPDLFEELTSTSLARTALTKPRRNRRVWIPVAGLAAAAAVGIVLLSTSLFRRSSQRPAASSVPSAAPVVAASGPPVFLARSADSTAPTFRGVDPGSRMPRLMGSVTSTADGIVTVDLGSLDGLAKGGEAEVLRDGNILGRIRLTTIFRERARAEMPRGLALRANDRIRVPPAMYLRAVLDEIAALSARGDSGDARALAGQAAAGVTIDIAATAYDDLNNLGGIAELRGDRAKARAFYEQALHADPPPPARQVIESNLARVRGAK